MPQRKRRRITAETNCLTMLPSDLIFHIIEYVGPTGLHYAVPYINKQFYNALNEKYTTETSGNHELNQYSCTKANLLWKQYYQQECQQINKIKNDHLYNFHKLYYNKFKIQKQPYTFRYEIEDIRKLLVKCSEVMLNTQADKYNSFESIQQHVHAVQTSFKIINKMLEDTGISVRAERWKSEHNWASTRYTEDKQLFGYAGFFDGTICTIEEEFESEHSTAFTFNGEISIISPFNGTVAKFICCIDDISNTIRKSVGATISIVLQDINGKKSEFCCMDNNSKVGKYAITEIIEHLGLNDIKNANTSQEEFIGQVWQTLIQRTLQRWAQCVGRGMRWKDFSDITLGDEEGMESDENKESDYLEYVDEEDDELADILHNFLK
jgi:hypothetical protein